MLQFELQRTEQQRQCHRRVRTTFWLLHQRTVRPACCWNLIRPLTTRARLPASHVINMSDVRASNTHTHTHTAGSWRSSGLMTSRQSSDDTSDCQNVIKLKYQQLVEQLKNHFSVIRAAREEESISLNEAAVLKNRTFILMILLFMPKHLTLLSDTEEGGGLQP